MLLTTNLVWWRCGGEREEEDVKRTPTEGGGRDSRKEKILVREFKRSEPHGKIQILYNKYHKKKSFLSLLRLKYKNEQLNLRNL